MARMRYLGVEDVPGSRYLGMSYRIMPPGSAFASRIVTA